MIYSYDKAIQMPVVDLYDTRMMAMALNAAKEEYTDAKKRMDAFYDKYGDFYTPLANDQQWYQQNIIDKAQRDIDDMYARGEDPTRTQAGRAAFERLARSMQNQKANINALKTNATLYAERQKAALALGDKYNRAADIAVNGDPSQFQTIDENGNIHQFNYGSPFEYKTIDQLLYPVFANVKPIYDPETTRMSKDGMLHNTVTEQRLMEALDDSKADLLNTPSGRYLYMMAAAEAEKRTELGQPITADGVFDEWARNRTSTFVRDDVQSNPVYMENLRHQHDIAEQNNAYNLKVREWSDPRNPANRANSGSSFNYLQQMKLASLRKLAGVSDDSQIPQNLVKNQKAILDNYAKLFGKYDKNKGITRAFTIDESRKILNDLAIHDDPSNFQYYLGGNRKPIGNSGDTYLMTPEDWKHIEGSVQYVSGFKGAKKVTGGEITHNKNVQYVMQYQQKMVGRRSENHTDQAGLVVIYPIRKETVREKDSSGKTVERQVDRINHNYGTPAVYKIPSNSPHLINDIDPNALIYGNDSEGYITSVSTQLGSKMKQKSVYDQGDNVVFNGGE